MPLLLPVGEPKSPSSAGPRRGRAVSYASGKSLAKAASGKVWDSPLGRRGKNAPAPQSSIAANQPAYPIPPAGNEIRRRHLFSYVLLKKGR